jgi:hypothetical protein
MARWRFVRWISSLFAASDVDNFRIDTYLYHLQHWVVNVNSASKLSGPPTHSIPVYESRPLAALE